MASDMIVQEWEQPQSVNVGAIKSAQYVDFRRKVMEQIDRDGIVRPKGYVVSWHSNPQVEKHHFGQTHPMKPWRLTLAKSLIMSYGMHAAMDTYVSRTATREELEDFHSREYLEYLSTAKVALPDDDAFYLPFNLGGSDCPVFDGLFEYCSMFAGASIDAARKLANEDSNIAINWSGGLHHAKKAEASGFCYVNDIVLAILQLLRKFPRVLYIDIDVHHGDGVEEAFWSTDRVLTCSFHKFDGNNFFPGTGDLSRTGPQDEGNPGAHHAINVPLNDGIDDTQYIWLFENIIGMCNDHFRPSAIVLQCGADSLAGDRLGRFMVQVEGHGACVAYCKSLGIPLMLVGGGGYTPRNVARAWTNETSIAIGCMKERGTKIPDHAPFREHFRYDELFPSLDQIMGDQTRPNKNTPKKLTDIVQSIREQLRMVNAAPSVQSKAIPPDLGGLKDEIDAQLREEQEEMDEELRRQQESGVGTAMELC